MVLEVAVLDVKPGQGARFEAAFAEAEPILTQSPGYLSHDLLRSVEQESRYLLLVRWESVEAHTVKFRGSAQYQSWRQLLHHFYDPFPEVEQYTSL